MNGRGTSPAGRGLLPALMLLESFLPQAIQKSFRSRFTPGASLSPAVTLLVGGGAELKAPIQLNLS